MNLLIKTLQKMTDLDIEIPHNKTTQTFHIQTPEDSERISLLTPSVQIFGYQRECPEKKEVI